MTIDDRGLEMRNQRAGGSARARMPRPVLIGVGVAALCAVVIAVLVLAGGGGSPAVSNPACQKNTPRSDACPHNATFSAADYVHHGDAYQCSEFASQADAQAVLRANPSDPNHLSEDRNGLACTYRPGPKDLRVVAAAVKPCGPNDMRSARCPQPKRRFDPHYYLRHGTDDYDCNAFASQADAQAVLRTQPQDPNKLDSGNGIACPGLRAPKDLKRVTTRLPS